MAINQIQQEKVNVFVKIYNLDIDKEEMDFSPFVLYKPYSFIKKYPNDCIYREINDKTRLNADISMHIALLIKDVPHPGEDKRQLEHIIDEKITEFKSFISVALGKKDFAQAFTSRFVQINREYHVFNDKKEILISSFSGEESSYFSEAVQLNVGYFSDNHKNLLNLINEQHSALQNKIYKAILWLGKSLETESIEDSFLQIAIALECFLSRKESGYFIQPSITVALAETLAFMVGQNAEDRIKINKRLKDLYSKRSAIVHNGSCSIDLETYYEFFRYVKAGIYNLLELIKKHDFKTIDDVYKYVEGLKFS